MSRFNPTSKQNPEELQVPQLRFLGEQDGPPERELRCRLIELFGHDQNVNRAYLVRVAYGGESFAVALCLRGQFGAERSLAETVGKIFASMFGSHQHLDISFLTEVQEAELATVCKPFFETRGGRKGIKSKGCGKKWAKWNKRIIWGGKGRRGIGK